MNTLTHPKVGAFLVEHQLTYDRNTITQSLRVLQIKRLRKSDLLAREVFCQISQNHNLVKVRRTTLYPIKLTNILHPVILLDASQLPAATLNARSYTPVDRFPCPDDHTKRGHRILLDHTISRLKSNSIKDYAAMLERHFSR
jgi:hypothetical protein